jgi:hypothetical protein
MRDVIKIVLRGGMSDGLKLEMTSIALWPCNGVSFYIGGREHIGVYRRSEEVTDDGAIVFEWHASGVPSE